MPRILKTAFSTDTWLNNQTVKSVFRFFRGNIDRSSLGLYVCSSDVFTKNTQAHKDKSADEENKTQEGRITRNVIVDRKDYRSDEVVDKIDESQ